MSNGRNSREYIKHQEQRYKDCLKRLYRAKGHKYYSQMGWKNMYPSYCKMIIHGNDVIPKQIDIYQRKELKKLFI